MQILFAGPRNAPATVVLAHGAGAPMDSPFMQTIAGGLARLGQRVARFEFPYMQRRRELGKRGVPDRAPVLIETWQQVITDLGDSRKLIIGGKSMGGRIASMVADGAGVAGLVCLGYPFHPPGKADRLRTEHLKTMRTPTLILHGERDPFGTRDEIAGYGLAPAIRVSYVADGDHSFRPRVKSGVTLEQNMQSVVERIAAFVTEAACS